MLLIMHYSYRNSDDWTKKSEMRFKNTEGLNFEGWEYSLVVGQLPNMYDTLRSISSPEK